MIDQKYDLKGFDPTKYIDYLCGVLGGRKDIQVEKEMAQEAKNIYPVFYQQIAGLIAS